MKISVQPYGDLPYGGQALCYVLENNKGMRAEITNFGGVVLRLFVPDREGKADDVVLGHPALEDYLQNPGYFGALVGRNSNRIAGAEVEIAGKAYSLEKNNGDNNLHSGSGGLSFRLMNAEARAVGNQPILMLTHTMEDLSDGFPGNIAITVAYALTDDNCLMIDYLAMSDKDTVINLTNHTYFNLAGHDSGPVYDHLLQLSAPYYNPGNSECFPTGEIRSVAGSPFDFRKEKPLGEGVLADCEQVKQYGGIDHNLILDGTGYRHVGRVTEPVSGRVMEMLTNLPAVQLYTGNGIGDRPGKDGASYHNHSGFCLETQFVPNAVHMPWLMSPIFRAGEEYVTTTAYRFSTL